MPEYEVIILPLAEKDIVNNSDYIFYEKKAPDAALQLLAGIREMIDGLSCMPEKHELDEDDELAERQIRKCYYKNYKIYFSVQRDKQKVYVLRVLHMLVDSKPLLLNVRMNG